MVLKYIMITSCFDTTTPAVHALPVKTDKKQMHLPQILKDEHFLGAMVLLVKVFSIISLIYVDSTPSMT